MELHANTTNQISDVIIRNGFTENAHSEISDYIKSCINNLILCHICSSSFNMIGSLRTHMKTKHPKDWITCDQCQRKFRTKVTHDKHIKTHPKIYRCTECPAKKFVLKVTLQKHQRIHKPIDPEPSENIGGYCNICKYNISNFLRDHMKKCYKKYLSIVDKSTNFPCTLCESKPKSLESLSGHMHLYHPGVKLDCDKCVRKFVHIYILEKHKREVHTRIGKRGVYKNETPQQCHICQRWCTRKWTLKNHIKSHDENNFNKCKNCFKTFKSEEAHDLHVENQHICTVCETKICQKNQVQTHYNIHFETVAMQCKQCNTSFNLKKELRKHEKEHQSAGVKRPFICLICWKSFHELRRAVECELNSHKEAWNCTKCHKVFKSPPELRNHTLAHISDLFACKICHPELNVSMVANKRTIFVKEDMLKKHMKEVHIEGQASLACHVCGKYFLLEVTLVHHLTDKHRDSWFKCKFCKRKFRLKETLIKHSKKKHEVGQGERALGQYITKDSPETLNPWLGSCHVCYLVFKDLPHLHMKQFHPQEFATCTYQMCNRKFRARVTLENHVFRDHLKDNESDVASYEKYFGNGTDLEGNHEIFSCSECEKVYRKSSILRAHIQNIHNNERNLQCTKCVYKTNRKYVLKLHLESHDIENKVSCNLCDKTFKCGSILRKHHTSVHLRDEDLPKYKCINCDYTTHHQRYLNGIHQRKHTGEKPHSCPVCEKKFARKFILRSHCKLLHGYNKQNLMDAGMYSDKTIIRATPNDTLASIEDRR